MRVYLLVSVAATLVLVAAQAQDVKDGQVEKDMKKLQGTWILVFGEFDGKPVAKEHVQKSKRTHTGNEVSVVLPHLYKEPIKNKLARLDPTKTPKEMDLARSVGPNTGRTLLAIYAVSEDTFRICYDPSGKERPREFKSTPGSGYALHVWKRENK
jgi:uncharacterized protein (TIGR03067 family)